MEDVGQRNVIVHSFEDDNEFSQSEEVSAFLDRFYLSAFPNMTRHEFVTDLEQQKAGIDRIVYLAGGSVVHIDEKIRRNHYNDFAIEYLSSDVSGKTGWINKDLDIDYIAYVWLSSGMGYLLDWCDLARAWVLHGRDWTGVYPCKPSQNPGYRTWFVCVPRAVVLGLVKARFVRVLAGPEQQLTLDIMF